MKLLRWPLALTAAFTIVLAAPAQATTAAETAERVAAARAASARVGSLGGAGVDVSIPALAETLRTPAAVVRWVREQTTLDVYEGGLRGERGTLFSRGGNALDRAILAGALLEEAGIAWRIVGGDLSDEQARQLVASATVTGAWAGDDQPDEAVGYDPTIDGRRRGLVTRHYWVQAQQPGGWVDVDPTFPGLAVGESATTSTVELGVDVPEALRRTVTIGVYFASSRIRGGEVLGRSLPLDDAAYRNVVLSFERDDRTVRPSLDIAGAATSGDGIPLEGLQRVWLQIVVRTGAVEERIVRDLYAAGSDVNLIDRDEGVLSIVLLPGFVGDAYYRAAATALAGSSASALDAMQAAMPADDAAAVSPELRAAMRPRVATALGMTALSFAHLSDALAWRLAASLGVRPFYARPRIIIAGAFRDGATIELQLDLRANDIDAIAEAGVPHTATATFNALRGRADAELAAQTLALMSGRPVRGVGDTLRAATQAGASLVTVHAGTVRRLDGLQIPNEARQRLTDLVASGHVALTSNAADASGTAPALAWWRIDTSSGALIGSTGHGGFDASTFVPSGFAASTDGGAAAVAATVATLVERAALGVERVLTGELPWEQSALACDATCDVAGMRRSLCSDERERTVPRTPQCVRGASTRETTQVLATGTSCSAQAASFYCATSVAASLTGGSLRHVAGPAPPPSGAFGFATEFSFADCACGAD